MDITIQFQSSYNEARTFTANWQDETHRYHVWIRSNGSLQDTIYRNIIEPVGGYRLRENQTTKSKIASKSNAKIVAAINAANTPEARLAAMAAYHKAQADAREAADTKKEAELRGALERIGQYTLAHQLSRRILFSMHAAFNGIT